MNYRPPVEGSRAGMFRTARSPYPKQGGGFLSNLLKNFGESYLNRKAGEQKRKEEKEDAATAFERAKVLAAIGHPSKEDEILGNVITNIQDNISREAKDMFADYEGSEEEKTAKMSAWAAKELRARLLPLVSQKQAQESKFTGLEETLYPDTRFPVNPAQFTQGYTPNLNLNMGISPAQSAVRKTTGMGMPSAQAATMPGGGVAPVAAPSPRPSAGRPDIAALVQRQLKSGVSPAVLRQQLIDAQENPANYGL